MKVIQWAVLILALTASAALATNESRFLAALKRYGIGDSNQTSKKPCLCSGGAFGGYVGVLAAFPDSSGYSYECSIPFFNPDGSSSGAGSCSGAGGTFEVLSK